MPCSSSCEHRLSLGVEDDLSLHASGVHAYMRPLISVFVHGAKCSSQETLSMSFDYDPRKSPCGYLIDGLGPSALIDEESEARSPELIRRPICDRLLASPFIPLNCIGYTHYAPGVKYLTPLPPSSPLHSFLSTHRVLRRILGCRVYWLRYTHTICELCLVPTSPLAPGCRSYALPEICR